MTNIDHLVEQSCIARESRLKHIDEMIDRAHARLDGDAVSSEIVDELDEIKGAREELEKDLDQIKLKDWDQETIKNAGPMGLWDIVAQRIEKLVERLEKH